MSKTPNKTRFVSLAVTTALASATLVGCTAKVAPPANVSAVKAEAAMAKGKGAKAVQHAEAAVLASPRDVGTRALLGASYVKAGRFASAASTLAEAMELGDTSPRTVITYALAQIAAGDSTSALETLDKWETALDPADYGLAVALAGRAQHGVHVLTNTLRGGTNTAKVRQNLAYAYALQGDWRSARLMAAQDVRDDRLGDRLGHWARLAAPEMQQHRVADLLGVELAVDPGQPAHLALSNHESIETLAAEAVETNVADAQAVAEVEAAPAFALAQELPAAVPAQPVVVPAVAAAVSDEGEAEMAEAGFVAPGGTRFVSREVAQSVPVKAAPVAAPVAAPAEPRVAQTHSAPTKVASPRQQAAKKFVKQTGDYRVQLGSYFSMSDAQAAWKLFQSRHPELEGSQKVISKAEVNGKIYYRVAAGGFAKNSAQQLCSLVKRGGGGCIAYAANNPLPGTIDNNVRVARR